MKKGSRPKGIRYASISSAPGPAGEEGEEPVYQKYGKGSVYKIYGYHYRIADITACPGNILVYVHSCKKGKFHDLGVVMDSHE